MAAGRSALCWTGAGRGEEKTATGRRADQDFRGEHQQVRITSFTNSIQYTSVNGGILITIFHQIPTRHKQAKTCKIYQNPYIDTACFTQGLLYKEILDNILCTVRVT